MKILLVEDDTAIAGALAAFLTQKGCQVTVCPTLSGARDRLATTLPDVAVLDWNLPDGAGADLCRELRQRRPGLPLLLLTVRGDTRDILAGFACGADDYVTKPFSPAELTARVDALFRRAGGEEVVQSGEISQPPFLLNTRNRTLEKNGQRVKLTQVEYAIMRVFMENPGKALSREEILDRVWGRDYFGELKIVDVNIRRLRLKIEDNVQNPTFITTVWGYGYKWDA